MGLHAFTLSMPGVNSWDGRWTGKDKPYVIVKSIPKQVEGHLGEYYSYSFGDGWRAAIRVKPVDASEARKLRRKSAGFCGYEWMVASIINNGTIKIPNTESKP